MAASKEWTEWHLTNNGWIKGTRKRDNGVKIIEKTPVNRVISFRFNEEFNMGSAQPYTFVEEMWKSDKEHLIQSLLRKYGSCPETL